MNHVDDLKRGLSRAWEQVTDGWHELTARAGQALTRFNPVHRADADTREDAAVLAASCRWALLAAEVRVDDEAVHVNLEAPGMRAEDFHLDVTGDTLYVRGEKHLERSERVGRYHVLERAYGSFERAVPLPVAVDEHDATARYEQGVLRVRLPRAAHTRTRRITVQSR